MECLTALVRGSCVGNAMYHNSYDGVHLPLSTTTPHVLCMLVAAAPPTALTQIFNVISACLGVYVLPHPTPPHPHNYTKLSIASDRQQKYRLVHEWTFSLVAKQVHMHACTLPYTPLKLTTTQGHHALL